MFIDELDDNFFTQRTEELIKDLANETATSERNTCCFIGNTNTKNFRMPNQAERRSYYIPIDRVIKNVNYVNNIFYFTVLFGEWALQV